MTRFGYIDADAEREARNNPAKPITRPGTDNLGFFMDAVIQKIETTIGTPSSDIVVETTIDMDLQSKAEEIVVKIMNEKSEEMNAGEAAFVAFSPDGGLRAMVGGRSYAQSQFNRAVQAKRQPGSSFKPFVYLAALEHGISHRDPVFDEPVQVGDWTPENYGGYYRGRITVSEALEHSVNTVAVQLSETVGREKVIAAAQRLGVQSEIENHRAIALGTAEMSLYELTGSYLPFANNGVTADPHMVSRILTKDGAILYQRSDFVPERVIDRDIAQTMTHMLYQTVERGTGRNANLGTHPVAGKTGTSQENRDAWFIGYSGHYIAGAWVGNDDASPMKNVTGAGLPSQVWKQVMASAHAGKPIVALPGAYQAEPDRFKSVQLRTFLTSLQQRLEAVRDGKRFDPYAEPWKTETEDDRPLERVKSPRRSDDDWKDVSHEDRARRAKEWAKREKERDSSWWPF
jgi:penicillin-binding protein 1A